MFSEDQKVIQRIAPVLQRVLIIDPTPASARMLADVVRNFFPCQVWVAPTKAKAAELLQAVMPQVVFVERGGGALDGVELTRQLRRSSFAARAVPVIIVGASPTAQDIRAARDAGAHEFMCRPFSTKDLLRRLEVVALRKRPWVEAVGYVGPDRRRFNSGVYDGQRKRGVDLCETPESAKIAQAFKILRSASLALSADPVQALRAMRAQAADLHQAGVATNDARLVGAAAHFRQFLQGIRAIGVDNATEVAAKAGDLLRLAPSEGEPAAARQAA